MSIYAYAVLPAESAESARTAAPEGVRIADVGGLAVAIRELVGAPAVDHGSLAAHDAIVRRLAGSSRSIVPLRFGQVVHDEEALGERIERARERLLATLEQLEGCSQITLRVFERADGAVPVPTRGGTGPGTRYLEALAARRRLAARAPSSLSPALARLAPRIRSERVERQGREPSITSVYHLVHRTDLAGYAACLDDAVRASTDLRVRASGPWPPYAFAQGWFP